MTSHIDDASFDDFNQISLDPKHGYVISIYIKKIDCIIVCNR